MSDRARATVYIDNHLMEDIKEVAEYESRSVANYLELVLLGSVQLEDDIRKLRGRRERPVRP
jgi:hypothetical protein